MADERRVGTADISEKLGYISGSLDMLHPKIDAMQKEIKSNTKKVAHVEKRLDKYRNFTAGGGMAFSAMAYVVFKWDKLISFFGTQQ